MEAQSTVATMANLVAEPHAATVSNSVDRPPVSSREIISLTALVILADLTIYRGHGYSGMAALFSIAPWLLFIGTMSPRRHSGTWIVGIFLALVSAKLVWSGSFLEVIAGFALLVAFSLTRAGYCPYVMTVIVFASQTIASGWYRLVEYSRSLLQFGPRLSNIAWLSLLLPLAAFVVFGVIFILANPDLVESFWTGAEQILARFNQWCAQVSWWELAFLIAATWITAGLLHPTLPEMTSKKGAQYPTDATWFAEDSVLYPAFRNTLVVVIGLFAVYLVFEFQSLWFRVFPPGFHYSGYAHRGAAWLTIALALATGTLSLIFRGEVLNDPRLPFLKRLAWVWSAQNLILAVAAFHRLYIYIGFNGLTRMRIIGIFGTATVVAGLLLVLWKITYRRDFTWLVRRQLWALAVAILLYAITPIDAIWVSYNVRRILAGDPAPSVELSVHPMSPEGVLCMLPLVHCENQIIRNGIRAMLAEYLDRADARLQSPERHHWTAYQIADQLVRAELRVETAGWTEFRSPNLRKDSLEKFHKYAYQWY